MVLDKMFIYFVFIISSKFKPLISLIVNSAKVIKFNLNGSLNLTKVVINHIND